MNPKELAKRTITYNLTEEEYEMVKKFREEKKNEEQKAENLKKGIDMVKEGYSLIIGNGGRIVIEDPNSGCWDDIASLEAMCTSRYFDTIVIYPC